MYYQNPPAEAVPAALPSTTATTNRRWFSAVPLIALCSLGILGLLLVATIVVALIPVYLSKRTVAHQANLTSSQVFLVYTIINDQRKREIREKRAYSDHSKTSCTAQERQETAVKLSYNYNFHSNQAKIVVDNMTFLSSFVVPFHLAYSPLCASESCQSELKEKCQQRFDAGIGTEILFTFTDDNGRLFTFKAALSSACK
ncbi:unnamed protein product [Didymodactylos carnosus]|uniref:Uncharacterized protein n=1 Tax=Didymodactylos carnosus TaxID=1234261 RepID=A0A8S2K2J7_9BILA|nr:unnamed protein product [Didymodactylos carnosus]CAF3831827.1 unnamed protein product [Didymodactylos carnosus]